MPDHDPLEELFRRSAGQLEQRPGLRNWRKMEKRLNGSSKPLHRRTRRQYTYLKPWHYAAAAVVLVLIIVLGLSRNDDFINAGSVLAQQPESIEELELISAQQAPVVAYESIPEGNSRQLLVVRNSQLPKLLPAPKYRL